MQRDCYEIILVRSIFGGKYNFIKTGLLSVCQFFSPLVRNSVKMLESEFHDHAANAILLCQRGSRIIPPLSSLNIFIWGMKRKGFSQFTFDVGVLLFQQSGIRI